MKMYKTIIEIVREGVRGEELISKLQLSDDVSEWLFVAGFWAEINKRCNTIFDQFEEDELDKKNIPVVIDVIEEFICWLDANSAVFGSTKIGGRALRHADKELIIKELNNMKCFISRDFSGGYKLFISL